MWVIKEFELRNVELDFTSSGYGLYHDQALYLDGTCVMNAVGLVVFDGDPVQWIVCDPCGITGCQPGGWLALRRAGDMVILSPAFPKK